ncbi:MAG: hypothetical protein CM1200mP15_08910 [Dehalococcoidia bacterium]|nr:MAG: hypothetical protein CM1200mP15_08910 [Dehalococcoidia bacterium]
MALESRNKTGLGQLLDMSMYDFHGVSYSQQHEFIPSHKDQSGKVTLLGWFQQGKAIQSKRWIL